MSACLILNKYTSVCNLSVSSGPCLVCALFFNKKPFSWSELVSAKYYKLVLHKYMQLCIKTYLNVNSLMITTHWHTEHPLCGRRAVIIATTE